VYYISFYYMINYLHQTKASRDEYNVGSPHALVKMLRMVQFLVKVVSLDSDLTSA